MSNFSSIQCYFILPPSSVGVVETVTDITTSSKCDETLWLGVYFFMYISSELISELTTLSTILELPDARDMVITTEISSKERLVLIELKLTIFCDNLCTAIFN